MPAKLDAVKIAVNFTVGAGASKIVNDIIKNNTDVETATDKVKVAAGSIVLGSMIADHASEYAVAKVDTIASAVKNLRKPKTAE